MIPKIIHYCWFGRNKLPKMACQCIASWRKYFPDYEIWEWNEDNFDVASVPYIEEAYESKKFAFVSDYARFKILYENGGVYFDTDVEVIRSMDDIIAAGAFMGLERDYDAGFMVASGLGLAAPRGLALYKDILDRYADLHFRNEDGTFDKTTTVSIVTSVLKAKGLKPKAGIVDFNGIRIYPTEYFSPLNFETRKLNITGNTRTIHHYAASWHTRWEAFVFWTQRHFGIKAAQLMSLMGHDPIYIAKRLCRYFTNDKCAKN